MRTGDVFNVFVLVNTAAFVLVVLLDDYGYLPDGYMPSPVYFFFRNRRFDRVSEPIVFDSTSIGNWYQI